VVPVADGTVNIAQVLFVLLNGGNHPVHHDMTLCIAE
jgi:hypothetical protein